MENGACICQCKGFRTASLCSHSLAVADHVVKLDQYLSWFHSRGGPDITAAASMSAPKNGGKKPGQRPCIHQTRTIENEQQYQLKWLDKTTARVCYGCLLFNNVLVANRNIFHSLQV